MCVSRHETSLSLLGPFPAVWWWSLTRGFITHAVVQITVISSDAIKSQISRKFNALALFYPALVEDAPVGQNVAKRHDFRISAVEK